MRSVDPPDWEVTATFVAFHEATYEQTLQLALRTAGGDRDLAYDATQDAYTSMWKRWPSLQARENAHNRACVGRSAVNRVIDHYRKYGRVDELDGEHDLGLDDPGLGAVLDSMVYSGVLDLVQQLPPRRRAVAALLIFDDYTNREIAETLGISESTVRTHIQQMRIILKPWMDAFRDAEQGGDDE